jgi:hypothetical protein
VRPEQAKISRRASIARAKVQVEITQIAKQSKFASNKKAAKQIDKLTTATSSRSNTFLLMLET